MVFFLLFTCYAGPFQGKLTARLGPKRFHKKALGFAGTKGIEELLEQRINLPLFITMGKKHGLRSKPLLDGLLLSIPQLEV